MPAPVLQFKRGNAGVAGTVPALRPGEPAISLNNFDFFIGIDTSVANNKFFGSHRYWGREDGTNSLKLKLVDKDGTNGIHLKSPDTLSGIGTYTLPDTSTITAGYFLKVGAGGTLSWDTVGGTNGTFTNPTLTGITTIGGTYLDVNVDADFSGITTFSNTQDNTLGLTNTGAVQVLGGVGIAKNLSVGAGLSVAGQSYFIGTATFYGGQINLGDSNTDDINVAGEFISNLVPNATNQYDLGTTSQRWRDAFYSRNVDITGNLVVDGNVTIGGTSVTLLGQDVYIKNKDIILGYTTSITNGDASTDDTANHAGVAIASTIGSPLVSFSASGINTLPDTYKQLMWFKQGTLGFGTDAFAFNYGVAIGTTNMANGVRLAVGTGITMSDTAISATNGYFTNLSVSTITGSITGTISTATRATTVDTVTAGDSAGTYYVTFVNSHNGTASPETVYTDDGIYYNPGTNTFTTQHADFTGNVNVSGITTLAGNVNLGDNSGDTITVTGTASFLQPITGTISTSTRSNLVDVAGIATNQNYNLVLSDGSGNSKSLGVDSELIYNPNTNTFKVGTGVGITQFSGSVSTGSSASSVPTSSAVIDYVNAADIGLSADTGSGSVNTTQTLTVSGTASEIETSASGQTITIGLPNAVVVGTSLSAPTIRTNLIKSSDTNTTAITITDNDVSIADDLTVGGNLYVNGSTTQVNTTTLNVKDALVDLGLIDTGGGVLGAPTSDLNKDIGLLLNYYTSSAKKAAMFWDDSASRIVFADDVSEGAGVLTVAANAYASIEVESIWINDCAGQSQLITCSGTERSLQNITVDAGTF